MPKSKKEDELWVAIEALRMGLADQETRIAALEQMVFALKENVKDKKQEMELKRKKKWLQGYPDQTAKTMEDKP